MLNATDKLASGLGVLGLTQGPQVLPQEEGRCAEECLTPRIERLTLEIAKLQSQIKQLKRHHKKLHARNPTAQKAREGFLTRKAAEYFAIDERRRRMQSAEPIKRVAKARRSRVSRFGGQVKSISVHDQCQIDGVEAAAQSEERDPDKRLSVSFLLS